MRSFTSAFLFALFAILSFTSFSQMATYSTAATYNWTCPAGVTSINVQAWGGGGGGGGTANSNGRSGGGGGGGAYAASNGVAVMAGTLYTITVGALGGGGNNASGYDGNNGGASSFTSIVAAGGGVGAPATHPPAAPRAAGGVATAGTSLNNGGDGGTGVAATSGGGGGGGAGSTGAGGNGLLILAGAGTPIGGGNGGAGITIISGVANNGLSFGGGGGGTRKNGNGGNGAGGQVIVSWSSCATYSLTATAVLTPVCTGSSSTITLTGAAANLPVGTYTVTYNLSAPNLATGNTATMTVTTAGTGTFTTSALNNAGSTTITITKLESGNGGANGSTAGCSNVISVNNTGSITVIATPAQSSTITGATSVCAATSRTYSVTNVGGVTYTWSTPPSWAITAGQGTNSITYTIGNASGTISVTPSISSCTGTARTLAITVNGITPGTYSVGPSGNYSSIGAAITALQNACTVAGAYIFELQSTYVSTVESFPLTIPNISWMSAINTVTFRPQVGATNLAITSGNSTGTLNLNAANWYTFSGRPGGVGTARELSIINTSTSGYTLQLVNDASNNTIKYCNVVGVNNSATEGVIIFSTTTGATGNDNNTIDNCDIGAGASTPANAIYSAGTTNKGNSNNTVSNCTIHDFFQASAASNGIFLSNYSDAWTISGNSFYETATRNITALNWPWSAINLTDKITGNGTLISGNFIGGQAANAGGSPLTITGLGVIRAIRITGGTGTANSVQGNTIANISVTSTSASVQSLIYHSDGSLNIGTSTGNIIGSTTGTGSVVFTSNAGLTANASFTPVFLGGAIISGVPEATIGGTVNCQNNTIGALSVYASDSCKLRIIDFEQSLCTFNISNNTIGNGTADNILNNTKQSTVGIVGFSGTPSVTHIISNNIIQNFRSTNPSTSNQVLGIQTLGDANLSPTGLYLVTGNTVHDLVSNSKMSTAFGTSIIGIDARASSPGQIISNNSFYNFTHTDATITARVRGILYTPGPTSGTNVISKNKVWGLKTASTTGIVRGIDLQSGPFSVENNMVVLGYDASGASITTNLEMEGIYNAVGANTFYYNSVHVTGTGVVSGASNSYAYYGNNPSSKIIKNNLFINSRSNAAGTAKNYGIVITNSTGLTSDYNDIYTSGTGGVFGNNGTDRLTLAAWQAATGQDSRSINAAASFVNPANDLHLIASPSTANFLINNQGTPIAVTTDIDGTTRNTYTPDPGYDEFQGTGSWIGVTSTAWTTTSNWDDNIVPTSLLNAKVLNAPNMPLVSTGIQSVKDLYLTSPAVLTVSGATLQIAGNIYNNATFVASNGSIEMNGLSSQLIPANAFQNNNLKDLIISNTNGVSLNGPLNLYRSFTYTGTGMNFSTNDNLTLKSTATETAWIGDVTGNAITGKVTVERYLSAHKAWRYLSVPTNNITQTVKGAWQEGAVGTGSNPVPGFGTQITSDRSTWSADGFDLYSLNGPSMKTYNSATDTWVGITSTANPIKTTTGYMTFIRGDRLANAFNSTPTQTVLRTKGDLYTGNQAPITVNANELTGIGNPYASALDMRYITKIGVKNFFYLWDPQLGGRYGLGAYQTFSYNVGLGDYVVTPGGGSYPASGSSSNYIQSGQAFFVQGDVGGGSLTFKEAAKTSGSALISAPAGPGQPQMRVNLLGINPDNTTYVTDGLLINYDNSYNNLVDDNDAIKMVNSSENLSVKVSNRLLVVESRRIVNQQDTIFLNLTNTKVQQYRFEINAEELDQPGITAFLEDNYLHTSTPISLNGNTTIDFNIVNIAGSNAADRFSIVFTPPAVLPLSLTSVKAYQKNKDIAVEWTAENESNMKEYHVEKSNDGNHFTKATSVEAKNAALNNYNWLDVHPSQGYNYYRIRSIDLNGKTEYSKVVKVLIGSIKQSITIYPNPVKDGMINLQMINQPAGIYFIHITNHLGQSILSKSIKHYEGSGSETIQLPKNLSHGVYQVNITKNNAAVSTIKIEY